MGEDNPAGQELATDPTDMTYQRAQSLAPKVAGLAAAAAMLFAVAGGVLRDGVSVPVIVFLAVVVLTLGVVATLVAQVTSRRTGLPGLLLAWGFVFLFITTAGLTLSSAFLGTPEFGAQMVARWLNAPELIRPGRDAPAPVVPTTSGSLAGLAPGVLGEVPGDDPVAKAAALANRPALVVRNATLSLAGPTERRVVSASRLVLADGGIVTNGGTLVIEVLEVESDNGLIAAFAQPEQPGATRDGASGGRVTLVVHRRLSGLLSVNLSGQAGRTGEPGTRGPDGPNGAQGERSSSSAIDCNHGPGRGGDGQPGYPGLRGETGGTGGEGGRLFVRATAQLGILDHIDFVAKGGSPGVGGPGGPGGQGGVGGPGGDTDGWCHGQGPRGSDGPPGPNGSPGQTGQAGAEGRLVFN